MYRPIKRFIYPPGFISLLLLPISCIFYLQQQQLQDKQHVLPIRLDRSVIYDNSGKRIPSPLHPDLQFIDIALNGNALETKQKLDIAQLTIRKLITSNDSINGIHFKLDSTAKYETLVRILSICLEEKAEHYTIQGSDIWIFNVCRERTAITVSLRDTSIWQCGYIEPIDCTTILQSSQQAEEEQSELINTTWATIKLFSISILLFLIMVLLSYLKVKKMSTVSRFNAHQRD